MIMIFLSAIRKEINSSDETIYYLVFDPSPQQLTIETHSKILHAYLELCEANVIAFTCKVSYDTCII